MSEGGAEGWGEPGGNENKIRLYHKIRHFLKRVFVVCTDLSVVMSRTAPKLVPTWRKLCMPASK